MRIIEMKCCVISLIIFILIFLSFPLLVIYLNSNNADDNERSDRDAPRDDRANNLDCVNNRLRKNSTFNENDELDGIERESYQTNVGTTTTTNDHKISSSVNSKNMDKNGQDIIDYDGVYTLPHLGAHLIYNGTTNHPNGQQLQEQQQPKEQPQKQANEKQQTNQRFDSSESRLITTQTRTTACGSIMPSANPDATSAFIDSQQRSRYYPSSPPTATPPNISNSSETVVQHEPNSSAPSNTLNQISNGTMHNNAEVICPRGKFSCGPGTNICLDQIKNCDGIADCSNGQDEKNCVDFSGTMNVFYGDWANWKKSHPITPNAHGAQPLKPRNCSEKLWLGNDCPCDLNDFRVIVCDNHQLKEIPKNFSSTVVKIRLGSNKIEVIDHLKNADSLISLYLDSNKIKTIKPNAFEKAHRLSKLYLTNNELTNIDSHAFVGLKSLKTLTLDYNKLVTFDPRLLKYSPLLARLHLDNNSIKLPEDTEFQGFRQLSWLTLDNNSITHISKHMLSGMESLSWLSLNNNTITYIEPGSFEGDTQLNEIDLSHNYISNLQRNMFPGNGSRMEKLEINFNPITSLPKDVFNDMILLESLHLDAHVRVCRPKTDGLSSARHLLVFPVLRFAVWIVALVCCCGNIVVLIWRHISQRENKIVSIFIKNLSAADLMMGVYLCAIGWHDLEFRDEYNRRAVAWMSSWPCTAIGFLAMLSSELSVLILTLITIERYRSIASNHYTEIESRARTYIIFVWLFSFLIASYPIAHWSTTGDNVYYASNGLCLPLHIDQPFTSGWQYSAFIFLGINFSAVMIIIILYMRMYIVIRQDRRFARPVLIDKKREDAILAARFFFIVVTDCLCWMPIVVIKIIALAEVSISSSVYAWLVVFVLPINSALNPIVYTLAAPTELREIVCRLLDRICFKFDLLFSSTREKNNMYKKKRKDTNVSSATCDTLDTSATAKLSTTGLIGVGYTSSANSNNSTPPSQPLKHHLSHPTFLCSCHGLFGKIQTNNSSTIDHQQQTIVTTTNSITSKQQPPHEVGFITHGGPDHHHHHLEAYPYNILL